ncbi:MAG: UdgX family uracil-DNA binding protein [Pseudomonadota bacterium]
MRLIRLSSEVDFDGWRRAARALITAEVEPEVVEWVVGENASLFAGSEAGAGDPPSAQLTVSRAFITLAQSAILNSDPGRFTLLYRLLWRLRSEPRLLSVASDADVTHSRAMRDAVARDIHKTHAFVRFREVTSEHGAVFVAWFEPTHHTLEVSAPFFVRRFASGRWSILTPRVSAHWDGTALRFDAGASRADAPRDDALEDLWRTYYASIFNPARLKTQSMQSHMPRKYWRNLPEAELIAELIVRAPRTTQNMIEHAPTEARLRAPRHSVRRGAAENHAQNVEGERHGMNAATLTRDNALAALRVAAHCCTVCPLYAHATQTVFGEGPRDAALMFIGEQPGDQEDLLGRPFVGPAGQLFDRALGEAEIDRAQVYVTNAVKHFKFEPRGKRRLHKTPAQREIEACRPWLEQEIRLVHPRLIVVLGATAASSLFSRPTPVQRNRSRLIPIAGGAQALITVHPSYLLRVPAAQHAEEYRRFIDDLRLALPFVDRRLAT